jgi:hypothetical protein
MTLHSLVHAFPHVSRELPRLPHAGLAVIPRAVGPLAEARIYLRRRRQEWKSALFALAVAGGSVAVWAFFLSRIA